MYPTSHSLTVHSSQPTDQIMMASLRSRFLAEFHLPIFSLQDANGRTIDLKESFSPSSKIVLGIKFLLVLFAISGVMNFISDDFFGWPI